MNIFLTPGMLNEACAKAATDPENEVETPDPENQVENPQDPEVENPQDGE